MIRTAGALGLRIEEWSDLTDLTGVIYGLDGLILHDTDLGSAVFDLKTGLAGELFQKLVNTGIPTAVVVPDVARYGERFAELAREHARHPQVRFVQSEEQARRWLETLGQ